MNQLFLRAGLSCALAALSGCGEGALAVGTESDEALESGTEDAGRVSSIEGTGRRGAALHDGPESGDCGGGLCGSDLPRTDLRDTSVIFESRSREYAEAREMNAMAQAATAERAATTLELERTVTIAHARARAAARSVRLVADTVLVVQHRALDSAWSGYSAGSSDLLSLFQTAHALYMTELREIDERAALARAHATLVAVTGRFDLIGVTVGDASDEGGTR